MHIRFTLPLVLISYLFINPVSAQDFIRIPVTDFNPDSLADPDYENPRWSTLTLPNRDRTHYQLSEDQDSAHIKATSTNSASGLVYKVDIDPREFPVIEWRWKINEVLAEGDMTTKKGDDYPVRIYITFDYDKSDLPFGDRVKYAFIKTFTRYDIPLRALNYIWANKAETGTISPNSYTNWVYMVAVRSGNGQAGEWYSETRNILDDYEKAFGETPPPINGVAIMSDSDNTGLTTEGYYGDIIFRKIDPR